MVSSHNFNSAIIYSPSCCSKPVRLSFIFARSFWWNERFRSLHWQLRNYKFDASESS